MKIRYVSSHFVTSSLKITTGENLQTSDIGSKQIKQGMNQLFGKFIKTSLLNEPYTE